MALLYYSGQPSRWLLPAAKRFTGRHLPGPVGEVDFQIGCSLIQGSDADSAATSSSDRRQGDTARRAGGTLEMSTVAVVRDH
jgi:hypothetical protein